MVTEFTKQGMVIRVRLTPNSSSCTLKGIFTDADNQHFLKITVISVPEKGKANQELLAYLAKKLKIAKSCLQIYSGETDRYKKVLVTEHADEAALRLNDWLKEEGYDC